jgi:hypothetical protein
MKLDIVKTWIALKVYRSYFFLYDLKQKKAYFGKILKSLFDLHLHYMN